MSFLLNTKFFCRLKALPGAVVGPFMKKTRVSCVRHYRPAIRKILRGQPFILVNNCRSYSVFLRAVQDFIVVAGREWSPNVFLALRWPHACIKLGQDGTKWTRGTTGSGLRPN